MESGALVVVVVVVVVVVEAVELVKILPLLRCLLLGVLNVVIRLIVAAVTVTVLQCCVGLLDEGFSMCNLHKVYPFFY